MNYLCPVCGYDKLTAPPNQFQICPSCGTEFENDDLIYSIPELRTIWILAGMKWWSPNVPPPTEWNPLEQLRRVLVSNVGSEKTSNLKGLRLPGKLIPQTSPSDFKFNNQASIVEFFSNSDETRTLAIILG